MTLRSLLFSAILFFCHISFCQNISSLKLSNRQSVLNDKAFFPFPDSAKNVARATDIMSAGPNENRETRIMLDMGKQRLVIFARELFLTADRDIFETIKKGNGENFTTTILTNTDSLLSILSTPAEFDTSQNAILINSLLVKTPDNSLFTIAAYINPEGFKNKKEFTELSERIFAGLSKGNRRLNFKAHEEISSIAGTGKKFKIILPEGYIINKDKGDDFEVLHFQKVKPMSDTIFVSLTIYTGNYPSYFLGEYGFEESAAEKLNGQFLGKPVDWLSFKDERKSLYLKEQKIPANNIEDHLIVHIAMVANYAGGIAELTRLVENIKVIN